VTDPLRQEVDSLRRLVVGLADVVSARQNDDGQAPTRTAAWRLAAEAAPPTQDDATADLEAWVTWAVTTFEVERWPRCWKEHHGVVLELVAFRQWWAQLAQGSSGNQLAVFHDHWWRFIARVHHQTTTLARCQGGRTHRPAKVWDGSEQPSAARGAR
jgi:hypothetical protein